MRMLGVAGVREVAKEKCIPINVTFEISLRCNLRCVHCYNFDRELPYPQKRLANELSDEEILRVLEEVHDEGCLSLALTGGEALAHPRIADFARRARDLAMQVVILTNGTLLSQAMAKRIADAGAEYVKISLYGADAATHDFFVKAPGAFERSLAGIHAAKEANLGVHVSFTVARHNAHQVGQMIQLADQLEVECMVSAQIYGRYDGTRSSMDLAVDQSTLEQLYRGPMRRFLVGRDECKGHRSVQCPCARSTCGISASGDVYPCIGAPLPSGNLREKSFREIWRTSPTLNWIRGLGKEDFKACSSCVYRPVCTRSSGAIFNNSGNYTGPDKFGGDWACMEAQVLQQIHQETVEAEFQ